MKLNNNERKKIKNKKNTNRGRSRETEIIGEWWIYFEHVKDWTTQVESGQKWTKVFFSGSLREEKDNKVLYVYRL